MIKMFIHNFKYSLKTLFKDKMLIFWTYAFPLILGSFFYLAFSSIEDNEKLKIINIAIVENEEFKNNEIYKSTFLELGDKNNKDRLFNIEYVSLEDAYKLLEEKDIIGYFELIDNKPNVTIVSNGINETIFKYVVEEIEENEKIINNITDKLITTSTLYEFNYDSLYEDVRNILNVEEVKINNISNSNLSYTMIEYYTLLAMTCLYGGILSMVSINKSLPNMSNKGMRVSVTPTKKSIIVLSSLLASYIVQVLGLALLFIFTIFVLKVNYGNLILVILLTLVGCLAGLSLGTFIGCIFKSNENTKTGILIGITMIGCFFSGMMGITMKYVIDKNCHIINLVNPASMITDGLYSLYYYDTLDRYIFNIVSLLIFSIVLIIISNISLRRQRYDSI